MVDEKNDIHGACCAHLSVDYDPINLDDGMMRERWRCRDCKVEFVRASEVERLRAENARLMGEEAPCESCGSLDVATATALGAGFVCWRG